MAIKIPCIRMNDTDSQYNIIDFGAKTGQNVDPLDNSKAIQSAIDRSYDSGGGNVVVPKNCIVIVAPFDLKSNINFHLEQGSEIIASPDETHYLRSAFKENTQEGNIWISAENVKNLSLTGTGTFNGNGTAFMGPEREAAFELKPFKDFDRRPHMFTLIGCKNLRIEDIHLKDSAYWGIHLVGCENVVIKNLKIHNNLKIRNSDGIDIDHSQNVQISDCIIESGDDSICLKNRREYSEFGPCENIRVKNCTMTSRSCAFKIGSENVNVIKDLKVENCKIINSNRGIGIQNRDEGCVEHLIFKNIKVECRLFDEVWWGKAEPIYLTAFKRAKTKNKDGDLRFALGQTEGKVGTIKDVNFINCACQSENGIYVSGEPNKIDGICFEKVKVTLNKFTSFPGGLYDRRPCELDGFIKAPTSGFYIDTAKNVAIKNCEVIWGQNKPDYYKDAVASKNVQDLVVASLKEKTLKK